MPDIENVVDDTPITSAWGNSVADGINDHSHDGGSGAGHTPVAHSSLSGVSANQHHAQLHAAAHAAGAGDPLMDATAPVTQAFGDTAAAGSATVAAKRDHRHGMPANPAAGLVHTINAVIDGGGAVLTTGIKGDLQVDFACTITKWTLLADQSGSVAVAIWRDSYANYPPVAADLIVTPAISGAVKAQSGALSLAVAAGDVLRFNVNSVTSIQRVLVALTVTRT